MPARADHGPRTLGAPTLHPDFLVPAILLAAFAAGATLTVMGAQETWIVSALGLSHGLAGLIQSQFFVGSMIGSLGIGWLIRRAPPRRLGMGMLALLLAGNVLSAVPLFGVMLAGRFLAGLANSALFFFLTAVLVHRFPDRQAALLNAQHAFVSLGGMASLLLARRIALAAGSWSAPFLVIAGLCAAAGAALSFVRRLPVGAPADAAPAREMFRVLGLPLVAVTVALMATYNMAEQAFSTFFPAYGERELGTQAVRSGLLTSLFWAGMGAGRLVTAALPRRGGERAQLVAASVCGSGMLGLALLVRSTPLLVALVFASGMTLGPIIPLAFSAIVRHTATAKAALLGVSNVIVSLGGSLSPLVVGFVGDRSSLRLGMAVAFLPLLAATAVFAGVGRPATRSRGSA